MGEEAGKGVDALSVEPAITSPARLVPILPFSSSGAISSTGSINPLNKTRHNPPRDGVMRQVLVDGPGGDREADGGGEARDPDGQPAIGLEAAASSSCAHAWLGTTR